VSDHVHVYDSGLVEAVDDGFGWDADGRHEQLRTGFNDDVDEFAELALGVVVVGCTRAGTEFRDEEVDTEGGVLIIEVRLELGDLDESRYIRS